MALTGERAGGSRRAWMRLLITFVVLLSIDLVSKAWAFQTVAGTPIRLDRTALIANPDFSPIPPHVPRSIGPGPLLEFTLVLNPGAVLGIAAGQRGFFIIFTGAALAFGVLFFARGMPARSWFGQFALGLVLAGGTGNLIDRIVFGRVRDFIHLLPDATLPFGWTWPGSGATQPLPWVFNIADVILLLGMVGLLIHLNRRRPEPGEADGDDTAAPDDAG